MLLNRKFSLLLGFLCVASCGDSSDSGIVFENETPVPQDFIAEASDFGCMLDMQQVGVLRIDNKLGLLDEAVALATDQQEGEQFPVGTILQLAPSEAMVKRGQDFDPDNNNWEYFELGISEQGTEINVRGPR